MDLGLHGRVAFVAASSRGIGRAIAKTFAAEGASVGMCARDGAALEAAAGEVRAHGAEVIAVPADLTNGEATASAVRQVVSRFGRLDALIVNAGGPPPGTFADLDDASWQRAHELTLMSAVHLIQAALPALQQSDAPSIALVSSFSVRQPIPSLVLSNSIRQSLIGLAKSLATEIAPVRVNTVLPGNILTDRARDLARSRARDGQSVDEMIDQASVGIPLRRYGTPEEFARVIVFISSPAAAYVTGTVLAVDGGLVSAPI